MTDISCTVIAGGVGAARFLRGLVRAIDPAGVTAIVNVADDVVMHGLNVSPDLDTVTYTLAGVDNTETGWGVEDETWQAMQTLGRYGGDVWFNLGDRDLGTNLFRTGQLAEGAPLSAVTRDITAGWGIDATLLPATDDRIETRVTTADHGEIGFQEYFVRHRHAVPVTAVRFVGIEAAAPGPGVLEAISDADLVVIAPSNPVVSIGPVVSIPGIREAIESRRDTVVGISPIVGGKALKGPADRLMRELGMEPTVVGVAEAYRSMAGTLVIDEVDAAMAGTVEASGMDCIVTDTIMRDAEIAAALATTIIDGVLDR
ncbi:MAG: 2-phospho-L-lactate transferase [Actinomycetota bacterium]